MKLEASDKYMKKIKFDHMMEAGRQQGRMSWVRYFRHQKFHLRWYLSEDLDEKVPAT